MNKRFAIRLGIASFAAAGLVAATPVLASAHTDSITGTSVCVAGNAQRVTWVVSNDYNLSETATGVAAIGSVSPASISIAATPNDNTPSTGDLYQLLPETASSATITVNGVWSDGFTRSVTGTISLPGDCPTTVPPPAPTTTTTVPAPPAPAHPVGTFVTAAAPAPVVPQAHVEVTG